MVRSQQLQSLRAESMQNPDNVSFALLNYSHIWTERTESVKTKSQILAHLQGYWLELHHFICTVTVLSVWAFKSQSRNRTWQAEKEPWSLSSKFGGTCWVLFCKERATEDVKWCVFRRLAALWPGRIWISILPEVPDQNLKEEEQQSELLILLPIKGRLQFVWAMIPHLPAASKLPK